MSALVLGTAALILLLPGIGTAATIADFVFVVDSSKSMKKDLKGLVAQIQDFDALLGEAGVDARFALVRFGTSRIGQGPPDPDIVVPFTSSWSAFTAGVGTLQNRITEKTESGSEALSYALENLDFRDDAVANLILYTDENDDAPVSAGGNREPPTLWKQSKRSPEFQARLDAAAEALIGKQAMLNLIVRPGSRHTSRQYGIPDATVLDTEGQLDLEATLANLEAEGRGESLQAQLLRSELIARSFHIREARGDTGPGFWQDFMRAKIDEVLGAPPVPEPGSIALLALGLSGLALRRRRAR